MKDVHLVLREKELDIVRVRKEIEALHLAISLLAETGIGSNMRWPRFVSLPTFSPALQWYQRKYGGDFLPAHFVDDLAGMSNQARSVLTSKPSSSA